jgi:hypothetical protein
VQINVDVLNQNEHSLAQVGAAADDHAELTHSPGTSRAVSAHGFIKAPEILALLCQLDADTVIDNLTGAGDPDIPSAILRPNVSRDRYERRVAPRLLRSELRSDLLLTMRGVSRVELVNISETGVLVEMSTRAVIGSVADLFITTGQHCHAVRARTVRSNVTAIQSGAVMYRVAFQFEDRLSLRSLLRT